MTWYRVAVGSTAAARPPQHPLLEYNEDDVLATQAFREWMTSPAIEEVPLAVEL